MPVTKEQGNRIVDAVARTCKELGVEGVVIDLKIDSLDKDVPPVANTPANTPRNQAERSEYDDYFDPFEPTVEDDDDSDTCLEPAPLKVGDTAWLLVNDSPQLLVLCDNTASCGQLYCGWFNKNGDYLEHSFPAKHLSGVPF